MNTIKLFLLIFPLFGQKLLAQDKTQPYKLVNMATEIKTTLDGKLLRQIQGWQVATDLKDTTAFFSKISSLQKGIDKKSAWSAYYVLLSAKFVQSSNFVKETKEDLYAIQKKIDSIHNRLKTLQKERKNAIANNDKEKTASIETEIKALMHELEKLKQAEKSSSGELERRMNAEATILANLEKAAEQYKRILAVVAIQIP